MCAQNARTVITWIILTRPGCSKHRRGCERKQMRRLQCFATAWNAKQRSICMRKNAIFAVCYECDVRYFVICNMWRFPDAQSTEQVENAKHAIFAAFCLFRSEYNVAVRWHFPDAQSTEDAANAKKHSTCKVWCAQDTWNTAICSIWQQETQQKNAVLTREITICAIFYLCSQNTQMP